MIHNRPLTVYTTNTRRANVYQSAPQDIGQFFERLRSSQAIPFSHDSYMALSKGQQDDLKDVGGFVLGELRGGRRKAGAVLSRCAAVLDADTLGPGETDGVVRRMEALGCCYCIYSTAKHSPDAPRLRIVIPFSEDITADEYEPVTRLLCQMIQPEMTWFDPSTAEPSRMMYYPAHCQDIAPVYYAGDKPLLDARVLLSRLQDWQDVTSWPRFPQEQTPARLAAKQGDPETKHGVVGAFCRVYDVSAAMDKFLPGVYEEADTPGRYTFTGGSTTGGAVLYDGGKFLYSHHATDPCGGKLVNAFDLVRLHCFGDKDDEAAHGARGNGLPSYGAMCELAVADEAVSALLDQEKQAEIAEAFSPVGGAPVDASWLHGLKRNSKGGFEHTSANVAHVLENDPMLKGRLYYDSFAEQMLGVSPLPWGRHQQENGVFEWRDADDDGLGIYLERVLGFRAPAVFKSVLSDCMARQAFNPVTNYLNGLAWDGIPRLDTLFIDYLGADDTPYTRAVTRKSFVAAVARAYDPGVKYDTMPVLSGPTGGGKSTLLDVMGGIWFTDSIKSFEGKEAAEMLQGAWLVEIAELHAFEKSGVERIKQFISARGDRFRAAYGRRAVTHMRTCVFFGTTNLRHFLKDPTGGRRFWPVYAWDRKPSKSALLDLPQERDQAWAEAVARWKAGERLVLDGKAAEEAKELQEFAREAHPWEDMIRSFLEKPIPTDWKDWGLVQRRMFWNGGAVGDLELVPRKRVCAMEIWCELLDGQSKELTSEKSRAINTILENTPGWERLTRLKYFGPHGRQRGFYNTGFPPDSL